MMRALIVAPAQVNSNLCWVDVRDSVVDGLDVHVEALKVLGVTEVGVLDVSAHGEVGCVDLQGQAGVDDGFVLDAHSLCVCEQVVIEGRVVLVR